MWAHEPASTASTLLCAKKSRIIKFVAPHPSTNITAVTVNIGCFSLTPLRGSEASFEESSAVVASVALPSCVWREEGDNEVA